MGNPIDAVVDVVGSVIEAPFKIVGGLGKMLGIGGGKPKQQQQSPRRQQAPPTAIEFPEMPSFDFPEFPEIPPYPQPKEAPLPDDANIRAAQRRKIAGRRGGRTATMLSQDPDNLLQ